MQNYKDIKIFAESKGFHVTSTTGGKHNFGSKHYRGLAIDVRTRDKTDAQVDKFICECRQQGLIVRDERKRPANQKVWSGAHLHIEIDESRKTECLKLGAKGQSVRELQIKLTSRGFLEMSDIDGHFGLTTENALKEFQIANYLTPDGIAGANTHSKLV